MWFLLAAAGAGYLAQRWQNIQKGQFLTLDSSQCGRSDSIKIENKSSKDEGCHSDIQATSKDVNTKTVHASSASVSEALGIQYAPGVNSLQSDQDNNSVVPSMDKFTYFEVKTKHENAIEHLRTPVENMSLHECSNDYDRLQGFTAKPLPVQGLSSTFSQELSYQAGSFYQSCRSQSDPCYFQEVKLNCHYSHNGHGQFEELINSYTTSCSHEVSRSISRLGRNVPGRMDSESKSTSFSRREMLKNESSGANTLKLITKNGNRGKCTELDRQQHFLHHTVDTEIITSPSPKAFETNHDSEFESLVGYGLSMAMLFMVSTARKEIEKMENILKETDDMVSDMKSELDERNSLSHHHHPGNRLHYRSDSFYQDDFGDDNESIVSVITEENLDGAGGISDLEAELEAELELLSSNLSSLQEPLGSVQANSLDIQVERETWKSIRMKLESRILELENALESALNELHMRDLEIDWWKDRVNWLLEHRGGGF